MQLIAYLNFAGNAREAMDFYASVFGGVDSYGDTILFADGQAGALVQRSGLAGVDLYFFSGLNRGAHNSQSSSPAHAGQPSGIAVGENGVPVLQELCSVLSYGPIDPDVLLGDPLCRS